jgi:hypothetical protein
VRTSCIGPNAKAAAGAPGCQPFLANLETTVYADRSEEIAAFRSVKLRHQDAHNVSPKLAAIAGSVAATRLKTVVLIHRANGMTTLVRLLRMQGLQPFLLGYEPPLPPGKAKAGTAAAERRDETNRTLAQFNASDPGNRRRADGRDAAAAGVVLVAAAEEFSLGINLIGVRRIVLADLSPGVEVPAAALVWQRLGRALRACSHHGLPPHMRTLAVDLFVAAHRTTDRYPKTLDEEKYDAVVAEAARMQTAMDRLKARALDQRFFTETMAMSRHNASVVASAAAAAAAAVKK